MDDYSFSQLSNAENNDIANEADYFLSNNLENNQKLRYLNLEGN